MSRFTIEWSLALIVSAALVGGAVADSPAVEAEDVELFAAMEAGQIDVQFIPRNANEANVLIENKTDRPLNVRLPEVFAGMPVLTQGFGFGDAGQGVGGGGGDPGFGGFNVAPEETRRVKVATLCLEHGKPDPNPRMKYEIKPIETLTTKPEVVEVVRRHAHGEVATKAAQAAAWHLANGMSWNELAAKQGQRVPLQRNRSYFSQNDLAVALQLAEQAKETARSYVSDSEVSPGELE